MRALTWVAFTAMALAAGPALGDAHRYRVQVAPDLGSLAVRACFAAPVPRLLEAGEDAPAAFRGGSGPRGEALRPDGTGRLQLPRLAPGECIDYSAVVLPHESRRGWRRAGHDQVLEPDSWLWRPEDDDAALELAFQLPPGVHLSVPWAEPRPGIYVPAATRSDWPALMAFTYHPVERLPVPGGFVRLAILDGEPAPDRAGLARWIAGAAGAVAAAHGSLPMEPQVLVVPIGRRAEAVPWGQVLRGGGAGVHFFVDQTRPLAEFTGDWTAVHEFSHLLHPFLKRDDAWLSEGIASYYQNVLRARAGLVGAEEAWAKLDAGFRRGQRQAGRATLREASATMLRTRAFMRVYWSGAAIALAADVELRAQSAGAMSLDLALARLADCCLPSNEEWSARELMDRLDRVSGSRVFSGLYARYAESTAFPDLAPVYADLGLAPDGQGRVDFRAAPRAALRDAIMAPR